MALARSWQLPAINHVINVIASYKINYSYIYDIYIYMIYNIYGLDFVYFWSFEAQPNFELIILLLHMFRILQVMYDKSWCLLTAIKQFY